MIRALIFVFALFALGAEAATPVISCTPSRISGTAPLSVIFDCSGTTDADTTKPFHDLLYRHNFGDANASSSTWENGANTNASKNVATGPIAAHVFESCLGSPFTVHHNVTDGTNLAYTTSTITVACADDTYSGTNTTCFTNGSDFTGCPSGATQTGSTSSWTTVIACVGTTKRCLVRRGDTFTASANGTVSAAGPNTIGTYGSGALPIISLNSGVQGVRVQTGVTDLRIMDLQFVGSGAGGGSTQRGIFIASSASGMTILRNTIRDTGEGGIVTASGAVVSNSVLQENTVHTTHAVASMYLDLATSAVLGNLIGPVGTNEHTMRVARLQRSVIANNTLKDPAVTKAVMTLRAFTHATDADDSFYFVASDNKIMQGTRSASMITITPNDNVTDQRLYDFIMERNWILAEAYTGSTTCIGMLVRGVRATIRNNLFDISAPTTCGRTSIEVGRTTGAEPVPDDVRLENNTMYSSATATTEGATIRTGSLNTRVTNQLCWYDNGTSCVANSGTNTVATTNSTTPQTTGTNPSFDGPTTTPTGFRIGTGSYAATGGTTIFPASNDDFFHCDDNTANERIGAFVPRARSRCRSAPGP